MHSQVKNFQFLIIKFFLRIQHKTPLKEDADNHVELLCPNSGEFPSVPLPPCVSSVTCGPPTNRFSYIMKLSSSGSGPGQVFQSQSIRSSYSDIWNFMTTHHLWFIDLVQVRLQLNVKLFNEIRMAGFVVRLFCII